jgi:hypothetical protein
MTPDSHQQLEFTRDKLRLLEQTYAETKRESKCTADTRELTLRSLRGLINQLKEEIARHEAHSGTRAQAH